MPDEPTKNAASDIVWIPAVPLPLLGWRTDRCQCGKRFRGKSRRATYELHYRREHMSDDRAEAGPDSGYADMAVTRAEAERIYDEVYAEVYADSADVPPERAS
jgi:hypothetical protein